MLGALVLTLVTTSPEVADVDLSSSDRHLEVQLIPASVQINALTSFHIGSLGRVTWRFNRFIGVYLSGGYNWINQPSATLDLANSTFRPEVVDRPEQVSSTWQAFGGVESIPLLGRISLLGVRNGEVGLAFFAALGLTGSRLRLSQAPNSFGDTGLRLAGHFGSSFRFALGLVAVHFTGRATMWSNNADRLNGCTVTDLRAMDVMIRAGRPHDSAVVTPGCSIATSNEVPLALNAIRRPFEDVVINVAGELGVSWSFF